MNIYLRICSILIGVFIINYTAVATNDNCDVIELIKYAGQSKYNELVCSGVNHLEKGDYHNAINDFENATDIRLFETPNYRLYTRLAYAYHLSGNKQKSIENLNKSELILKILVGAYKCQYKGDNPYISDGSKSPVSNAYVSEVADIMCSEGHTYIYGRRYEKLERMIKDAKLVEYYLKIKRLIKSQ